MTVLTLTMPLLAFIVGVVLGPIGSGLLTPDSWGDSYKLLEECALSDHRDQPDGDSAANS
ncbi:hypothetical protein P4S73_02190 [Paraglaciecola sp. Hal342]